MNRTTRPRTPARNRPEVEPLESRALLSLAGVSVPFTGTGVNSTPLIPPISGDNYGASPALTVLDPDGTIVQATSFNADGGEGAGSYSVVKLNADGSLDTAFGQNGRVTVQVGNSPGVATSLVVRPDGTIDVGGRFDNSIDVTSAASVGVIQITPTGALDTSFGNQGFATLPALDPDQQSFSGLGGMTLTASGQLIVVGQGITQNGTSTAFYAARLNQNGSLDSTFGTGGVAMVPVTLNGITINQGTAVAVQPSGRIIVAGKAATAVLPNGIFTLDLSDSVVFGLTSNGTLDTSFGGPSANGEVILAPVATSDSTQGIRQVAAMTLSSSGQIVLAETDTSYSSAYGTGQAIGDLTRLNADGTIDTTFGAAGTATFTNGLTPLGVTVQANGQILVPGEANVNEQSVARYNADGSPDVNFGTIATPGLISFPTSYFRDGGPFSTAAIDANGRIVLGGTYDSGGSGMQNGTAYFSIARITSTSTPALDVPPADYDGSGQTNLAVYLAASGEFAYRPSHGGTDVVVPFGIPGLGQTIPAPGDYTGAGQTEIAAYLPSQGVYAYRPATGGPDVLQSFGIPGPGQSIPAPGDYFGTGVDDIAVYMPSIGSFGIRPSTGGPDVIVPFGIPGMGQSIPAPADYFNTGQTDIAVYLTSLGAFAIRNPAGGPDVIVPFGIPGAGNSIPIPGDYDGSGKTELAVYFPKLGEFAYRPANGGPDVIVPFGIANDGSIPVPGDYTGVGYDEIAVYDPNYPWIAYRPAQGGADVITPFGSPGRGVSLPTASPVILNIPPTSTKVEARSVSVGSNAVPAGPKAMASSSLVRIASTLPAQADPSKPKG